MCEDTKCCCQKPENLQASPKECSPEQIRECHGEAEEHPCVPGDERRDADPIST